MRPDLREMVDRADELADELATEIRGEHLLDAMAQLGLRLDRKPTDTPSPEGWRKEWLDATYAGAARIAELLPELDGEQVFDAIVDRKLMLTPLAAGEPNLASAAWFAVVDEERGRRNG